MNDDTNQAVPSALAAYVKRQAPSWMHDGSPAPDGMAEQGWRAVQEAARRHHFERCAFEFGEAVARGYRVQELETGTLSRGAEVGILDGSVRRRESVTDAALQKRAERVLAAAHAEHVALDPVVSVSLESMSAGTWAGRGGDAQVDGAEEAVAAKRRERAAEARQVAALPVIEVGHRFQAIGRTFPPGRQSVQPELLEQLQDWRLKMEAEARRRKWPSPWPAGASRPWPPFVVVAGSAPSKPPVPQSVW